MKHRSSIRYATFLFFAANVFAQTNLPAVASPALNPGTNIVLVVNGQPITLGLLQSEAAGLQQQYPGATAEQLLGAAQSNLVQQLVMRRAAEAAGIEITSTDVELKIRETKAQLPDDMSFNDLLAAQGINREQFIQGLVPALRINQFLKQRVPAYEPTATEIDTFYAENKAKFVVPETIKVQHFMLGMRPDDPPAVQQKRIQKIQMYFTQIQSGQDFDEIARLFSEGPMAGSGGRLGFLDRQSFAPELQEPVFGLAPEAFSEILRSSQGLHFFKLLDRRPAEPLSLENARGKIHSYLKQQHQLKERTRIVQELVAKANIQQF